MNRDARAVIFDFDGTLFDASDAICHSFNAAFRARGRPELRREEILPWIGRPLVEIFPSVLPGLAPSEVDALVEAYREAFWPVCVDMTRPLPGLRMCLDALRGRARLGIATNRTERGARMILEGFGASGDFETIVAIEHVRKTKPDPEAVVLALSRLGAAAGHSVMVGDTPDDMRAGRAADVLAVGVSTGAFDASALMAAGAHHVIGSLRDLPALLERTTFRGPD